MDLFNSLKNFLEEHAIKDKPLLLGLSGGPDSMALFYLLLRLKQEGWQFAIAHVNHNWRVLSKDEAKILEQIASLEKIPFHLLTLDPKNIEGNLELKCRLERLKFFKNLCTQFDYQAVILGHHLDDQVETVLKRLFEGAHLTRLYGLKHVNVIDGLKLLRPFLGVQKLQLLNLLKTHRVSFFQDSTNEDPAFTRGRFRTKIIPYLKGEFGKNIEKPLSRLMERSLELDGYLKEKIAPYQKRIVKTPLGVYLDFSDVPHLVEMKYLIRELTAEEGFYLSCFLIDKVVSLIETGAANKSVRMMGKTVIIDRKKLFILRDPMQDFKSISLELDTNSLGSFKIGPWKVLLTPDKNEPVMTGWTLVFHGCVQISIPEGKYRLIYKGQEFSFLNKLWTDNKVPNFLRGWMPILLKDEQFFKEFLTEEKSCSKQFIPNTFKLMIALEPAFKLGIT